MRKILKKHDKSSQIALTPSLGPWVERRAFASLRGLDALLRAAENFLALLVAPLDGRRSGQAAGPNGAQAACGGAPAAAKVEPPASIVWQPRPRGAEVLPPPPTRLPSTVGAGSSVAEAASAAAHGAHRETAERCALLLTTLTHASPGQMSPSPAVADTALLHRPEIV